MGDFGELQTGWDSGPGQVPVEDPSKDSSQLARKVLQRMSGYDLVQPPLQPAVCAPLK